MSFKHCLKNEEELHKVLVQWNQTTREYSQDSTFHMLFEAQVKHSPNIVAVEFADACLTYRELNSRANQLAHKLQRLGVGPEILVGLCVERGLDLVVGILGIHKAGGVYLPLDPAYPAERLRFMMNDAKPPFIISQTGVQQHLPEYQGKLVHIDTDCPLVDSETEENPVSGITIDSLAYVIYTSGSTGQPKGTLLEHRGLSKVSAEQIRYFNVGPGSRVLQFSSPNFDASLFDIVMALASGATLVLASQEELLPGPELVRLLREQSITILTLPPSVLNVLLPPSTLPELKVINVAGEACSAELVSRWAPGRHFFNLYGPTECTIWATAAECQPTDRAPHIGRPIGNTLVYILNDSLQPVPVGEPGELFLGGVGLARGYLNRESLTAEKFLADPFNPASPGSGARMYRTGDRVRYLEDGNIVFLGRVDEQVKIRGFRIEPGEVETVLARLPGVEVAVVQLCEDDSGNSRLVAYVVLEQEQQQDMDALRSSLQETLPAYMVPSIIVPLDKLPLTLNGKLDHQALPAPDWHRAMADLDYQPPRNSIEKLLAGIYAEVLGVDHVGVRADFFKLGGHSLNVSQLIARVRELFKVEIPFRSVFENPVLSTLASDIQQCISGERLAEPFSIEPIQPGEPLPLSYSQERVWFLQQLDASNRAYNVQATIHWYGKLDISALERGLTEVVRRHQILRTTFIDDGGTPVQRIHQAVPVKLQLENFESSDPSQSEQQIDVLLQKAFQQPFDVTQLPLVRWTLIRLNDNEYLMTHVEHHLIHDGWSFNVFLGELLALYRAYHEDNPTPLPEPDIQFVDFARWQRRWIQGEEAEKQFVYWKQRLSGCQPLLELPYDRPRPAVQSFRGAAPRFELPRSLCIGIEKLCRKAGVTPFMAFLTGLYILLYRYSSRSDICVGTGMANRRWHETEGLLGMIINNVVLRTDISGNPSVCELLVRVRECTLDASSNQDLPFEKVVEILQPERSLSYNPLFQVMFGMHDSPLTQPELPGLHGEMELAVANGGAKFDLTIVVVPASVQQVGLRQKPGHESWTVIWEYSTDLFDATTASRMFSHYQRVLEGMVSAPDCLLSELSMQSDAESRKLLLDWNRTQTDYPRKQTVHELFEQQVSASPDAIAVEYKGNTLSYAQLNTRANQLAHYLQAREVVPEALIGICVERSLDMVVALLGIIKAGGAYLPLDSEYPQSRLTFMLEDAQVAVLLTTSSLKGSLPPFSGELICLDNDALAIAGESTDNPVSATTPNNLIYVIYTSGSTGNPKGTLIEHKGVVRLVKDTNYVELGAQEVFLQFASTSFDASTFELWGSLLNGAKLVVFPAGRTDLQQLGQLIQEKDITTLWLTSALFSQMVDNHLTSLSSVRQLLVGGEALSLPHVKKMLDHLGESRLINGYGPTENTTFTCCHVMTGTSQILGQSVPIGRPISNTTVYILDGQMKLVPVGIPGELYIGGEGLARGYMNQPELTAEKFVSDPFNTSPPYKGAEARLYRTGDRVRYRDDGSIEFLGRFDHQLKLRGFRIEPGEIEAVLERQPDIETALVVLREDASGDKQLVAYVVPSQGQSTDINALRDRLQTILPIYMVPSVFMQLDVLPLTANSKIDLDCLPEPDISALQSKEKFVEPRNKNEQRIAAIWKNLLNLERVGIHDNFFILGGHSLLATQMISRLKDEFGLNVPLTVVFESPSVAELASCLDAAMLSNRNTVSTPRDIDSERECGEI